MLRTVDSGVAGPRVQGGMLARLRFRFRFFVVFFCGVEGCAHASRRAAEIEMNDDCFHAESTVANLDP